jgi:hypothetical protein
MTGTKDITWYKGIALERIRKAHVSNGDYFSVEEIDELLKGLYFDAPKISVKDVKHEEFQGFKEYCKFYAISILDLDLDDNDGIKLNFK